MHSTRKVILVIEPSTAYGRGILRGIAKYSRLHGPWSINMDPWEIYNKELPRITDFQGQGIIARVSSEKVAEKIMDSDLPAVTLASDSTKRLGALKKEKWAVIPRVISNSEQIGIMAADHFMERGFKHFAFCGIPYCSWSQKRKESFTNRITERGHKCIIYPESKLKRDRLWEKEQLELAKWLKSLPKPVGLFACNDERARVILETVRITGLMTPEHVAILGVDNDELLCDLSHPHLSSISMNLVQAGYEAAELLDRLMSGSPMTGQEIVVDPIRVVVRQSTDVLAVANKNVAEAIRYIREHAKNGIRVDDIATAVNSSRRLLERHFQRILGRTILQEIQRVKVELAKQLLIETDSPISCVAEESGFSNATQMGVTIKRFTKMTPLSYRKNFRNK